MVLTAVLRLGWVRLGLSTVLGFFSSKTFSWRLDVHAVKDLLLLFLAPHEILSVFKVFIGALQTISSVNYLLKCFSHQNKF